LGVFIRIINISEEGRAKNAKREEETEGEAEEDGGEDGVGDDHGEDVPGSAFIFEFSARRIILEDSSLNSCRNCQQQ